MIEERGDDDLADLERVVLDSLIRYGLDDAERAALHLIHDVRRQLAGNCLYISRGFHARNRQIRIEFNGRNSEKLAAQFGLSRRRIEQIVQAPGE